MTTDAELSRDTARVAGQLLLALREGFGPIDDKDAANELRKRGDREAHLRIMELLSAARPDDAILSEEGKDDAARLDAERIWIVDPLDGTYEYGQGRADFAVHIALWQPASRELSAATVDLPAQGLTRSVLDPISGPPPLPTDRPIRIVASRSRPPATLPQTVAILAETLAAQGLNKHGVEIMDVGSVGAKVNEIISGRAEAYVHDTGFYEWDVAAPYGVAMHYGLAPSHLDGSAVMFNQMPPYVTDLMVSHPALVAPLRAALQAAAGS
ncbi:MAG TPA: 3'(2'),5'-bisphosphate nucleotidase CysQ [Actinobacteria bacterium]|jgi:3'(2'), 5'-bisphosphate nucleotidase|nr:3'(2'),5'-bisphosphate nucleotidase CysQ [Actinomycetota bacterium]